MSSKISASAPKVVVDFAELTGQIFEVAGQLGKIEGIAQERGYPDLPPARYVDCGEVALECFESHGPSLNQMRDDLHKIYVRLREISTDLTSISMPKITAIFERQIELLHVRRGCLEASFREFQTIQNSHRLLKDISSDVQSLGSWITEYEGGTLPIDEWDVLSETLEDLVVQLRVLFPEKKKERGTFASSSIIKRCKLQRT